MENLDAGADTPVDNPAENQPAEPASALAAIEQSLGYAEKPAEKPADAAEGAAPADKPVLGADGKPVEKPAVGADGKPVAKPAPDAKKAPDYTAPTGLTPEATRRFQALVGDNKAIRAENEQLKAQTEQFKQVTADVQEFRQLFDESKCQPQQFELAIDFIKAVNTGNFDRAAGIITDQMRQLTLATGRDLTAPDPLQGHTDLQQELAANQITRARAIEIAASRQNQAAARQTHEHQQRTEQQQQQWNKAVETGGAAVQAWQNQKMASDIDWPAKAAQLDKELDWLAQNVPPAKWVAHLEKFYNLLQVSAAPAKVTTTNQPLRANGGAGGAKPAPGSMLEAMNRGLGYEAA